ncbi:unnamed protein product, partial [Cyprideis torosa]
MLSREVHLLVLKPRVVILGSSQHHVDKGSPISITCVGYQRISFIISAMAEEEGEDDADEKTAEEEAAFGDDRSTAAI